MGRLTRALLNRSPGPGSPHILLLADELQEILGTLETVSVGRLLALARSRGVSCFWMFQQRSQLPRDLQELIRTNATVELVFRANHRDAASYAHALPVAEDEPDEARVRAALVRRLERLPRRQFALIIKDSPHGGQFLEAPEINIPRLAGPGHAVASCGESAIEVLRSVESKAKPTTSDAETRSPALGEPGDFPELG
jgi:hypothetical protein